MSLHRMKRLQRLKQRLAPINESNNEKLIFQQFPMTKELRIKNDTKLYRNHSRNVAEDHTTQFTEKEFLYLLSVFPNLKSLDLVHSTHREHYMKILSNCQQTKLPRFLEKILMENKNIVNEDKDFRIRELAVYTRFQESLKYMNVDYTNNLLHGKSFMDLLSNFKNLSILEVWNKTNRDLTFFDFVQSCPSLSSLSYTSHFPIPEEKATRQLATMTQILKDQNSSITHSFKNLTTVQLTMPSLSAPYVDFFTNHSPESLDNVDFHITRVSMHEWIRRVRMDSALKLCERLQKLNSVSLVFMEDPLRDHEDSDTFYRLLNALTGERVFRTRTHVHKDCEEEFQGDGDEGVKIEIHGSTLRYEHCFDILDENMDNNYDDTFPVPSALSFQQLSKTNEFHNRLICVESDFIDILMHYLEFTKRFLPKATNFLFFSEPTDYKLEAKCPPGHLKLETMTHLLIDGFRCLPNELNYLPEYFPSIQELNFGLRLPLSDYSKNENAPINLTNFKNLQTLTISARFIKHFKEGLVFLLYMDCSQNITIYLLRRKTQDTELTEHCFEQISLLHWAELKNSSEPEHMYSILLQGPSRLKRIELRYDDKFLTRLEL